MVSTILQYSHGCYIGMQGYTRTYGFHLLRGDISDTINIRDIAKAPKKKFQVPRVVDQVSTTSKIF
jgi:hypothetical protein